MCVEILSRVTFRLSGNAASSSCSICFLVVSSVVFRSLLSRANLCTVGIVSFVLDGRCRVLRYATLGSRRSFERASKKMELGGIHKKSGCLYRAPTHPNRPVLCSPESPGVRGMARDQKLGCGGRLSRGCGLHFFLLCRFVY